MSGEIFGKAGSRKRRSEAEARLRREISEIVLREIFNIAPAADILMNVAMEMGNRK